MLYNHVEKVIMIVYRDISVFMSQILIARFSQKSIYKEYYVLQGTELLF